MASTTGTRESGRSSGQEGARKARARLGLSARVRLSLRWLRLGLVLAFIALVLPSDGFIGPARLTLVIREAVDGQQFNLLAWEVQAVSQKLGDAVRRPGAHLSPDEERKLVLGYMAGVDHVSQLTAQIEAAAAGLGEGDLAARQTQLESALEVLRAHQESNRSTVERILEEQVSSILDELGFTTFGQVFPPVSFQFTESPNYLVISPRERIRVERGEYLDPAMSLDEIERIEGEVAGESGRSTLIEGTGGFSSYPTMVLQYSDLRWVIDTVAHEWAHTYLFLRPLGWNYYESGAMRTINETVASIVGGEVARMVLEKYYPDLVGPDPWPMPLSMRADWLSRTEVEPEFEFGAFMRRTRLRVDALLEEGKVAEAEQYMEERRQTLVERGYAIRKLNQAYFAFHGSYQVGASAGTDPIGGKLRALRARLGNLPAFLRTVATFTRAEDLDAALRAQF